MLDEIQMIFIVSLKHNLIIKKHLTKADLMIDTRYHRME